MRPARAASNQLVLGVGITEQGRGPATVKVAPWTLEPGDDALLIPVVPQDRNQTCKDAEIAPRLSCLSTPPGKRPAVHSNEARDVLIGDVGQPALQLRHHQSNIAGHPADMLVEGVSHDVADALEHDHQLVAHIQIPWDICSIQLIPNIEQGAARIAS